jgi:hypothetical protein
MGSFNRHAAHLPGGCDDVAANSVTAAEIVTPDGHLVRADTDHEPDLFWAVRRRRARSGWGGHTTSAPAPVQ